ncbi:CLUMA_CG009247, isoform A [Clunio marinus]|uniref:CLUMA_CG009247, isoform A n=1 Tax=Clunio marinus TaxID=568069 RepID=A0A1J1I639_9DIPT|nr:CLUMA_CG009247, isoform A [Clunio marinus]
MHRYRDPCSLSLNEDDNHTITLVGNANKKAVTLAKTCEQVNELRDCRAPRDWSILALQNTRTGKSHYLVICKCPSNFRLGEFEKELKSGYEVNSFSRFISFTTEGPLPHDQPTYAGLPGINVYGMLCVPPNSPTKFNWKISQRPAIHTTYRTKNTTIEAAAPDTPQTSSEAINKEN